MPDAVTGQTVLKLAGEIESLCRKHTDSFEVAAAATEIAEKVIRATWPFSQSCGEHSLSVEALGRSS